MKIGVHLERKGVFLPYFKSKFGKTFFTSKGRKSKKNYPFIFLHGGPGGQHNPSNPLFELSKQRKVCLYDQIGGGKSSALKEKQMKIETFVEELSLLLKHLKIEKFHLGGSSWGTTLALEYYLRKKNSGVQSLIFQSPMFSADDWENDSKRLIKNMSANDQKIIRYCHEIEATDSKVYKEVTKRYYLRHVLRDKKRLEKFFSSTSTTLSPGDQVYQYMWGPSEFKPTGTLKNYDRNKDLKKIKIPSLIICGQHDEATPKTGLRYSKKIPQGQFVEIKGASHSIMAEKPKPMLNSIQSFLDQIENEN